MLKRTAFSRNDNYKRSFSENDCVINALASPIQYGLRVVKVFEDLYGVIRIARAIFVSCRLPLIQKLYRIYERSQSGFTEHARHRLPDATAARTLYVLPA